MAEQPTTPDREHESEREKKPADTAPLTAGEMQQSPIPRPGEGRDQDQQERMPADAGQGPQQDHRSAGEQTHVQAGEEPRRDERRD